MAAELTATPLLAVLVAALAALAVLTVFASLAGLSGRDLVRARLGHVDAAASGRDLELAEPFFDRVIRPVVGHLRGVADRLTSRQRLGRTELRLSRAGSPANMRPLDFVAFKLALTGGGGGAALLLPGIAGNGIVGVLLASLIVGGGLIGPELWLNRRIRTRQRRILLALPDTLDLLTISVRAGLSFDGALARVVEKTSGPLSDEFRRALNEVRVGRLRRETLRDVAARAEVPALSNFIGAIIQAEQLGVPIGKVLQVQSDQLRIERRQRAEELAAKAPIKMLFPLIGCIFPSMFIVLLGPAVILLLLMGTG